MLAWLVLLAWMGCVEGGTTRFAGPSGGIFSSCLDRSDPCSVSAALAAAQEGDIVEAAVGNYTLANLDVTVSVTIRGAGAGVVWTTPIASATEMLRVVNSLVVVIDRIEFRNSDVNASQLVLLNDKGDLTLVNCTVSDNTAPDGLFQVGRGCIFRAFDTVVEDNTSGGQGGWIEATSTDGGSRIELSRCTFRRNYAASDGGVVSMSRGESPGLVQLVDCLAEDNESGNEGGAVHLRIGNGAAHGLVVERCVFRRNLANSHGGALSILSNNDRFASAVRVSSSTFEGNRAGRVNRRNGGAFYQSARVTSGVFIEDCSFFNNSASQTGGALALSSGTSGAVFVRRCLFVRNTGENTGAGGMSVFPTSIVNATLSVTVTDSTFRANQGSQGAALFWNPGQLGHHLKVEGSLFEANVADTGGGGALALQSSDAGRDVFVIDRCKFIGNSATGSGGGAIRISPQNVPDVVLNISLALFENNTIGSTLQSNGGALDLGRVYDVNLNQLVFRGNIASGRGGAISCGENPGSTLRREWDSLEFYGNEAASGNGGAIYQDFVEIRIVELTNALFCRNSNETFSCESAAQGASFVVMSELKPGSAFFSTCPINCNYLGQNCNAVQGTTCTLPDWRDTAADRLQVGVPGPTTRTTTRTTTMGGSPTTRPTISVPPGGTTTIDGDLDLDGGGSVFIGLGGRLNITGVLTVGLDTTVTVSVTQSGTVEVISAAGGILGTFGNVIAVPDDSCKEATVSETSTANGVLSVTVQVDDSGCSGGLALGAIIGIAVGCVAAGVLIAVLACILVRRSRQRHMMDFKAQELEMQKQAGPGNLV